MARMRLISLVGFIGFVALITLVVVVVIVVLMVLHVIVLLGHFWRSGHLGHNIVVVTGWLTLILAMRVFHGVVHHRVVLLFLKEEPLNRTDLTRRPKRLAVQTQNSVERTRGGTRRARRGRREVVADRLSVVDYSSR